MPANTQIDTVALVRRLQSSDDAERQQAQAELQALIVADVRRIRQCRSLQVYSSTTSLMLYLIFIILDQFTAHNPLENIIVWVMLMSMGMGYLAKLRAKDAIHNINTLNIPQVVGALLDVYGIHDGFVLGDTRPALIQLLPRLQATDANLLTGSQRKQLYSKLSKSDRYFWYNRYWNAELKTAILRALEQIGDEKAVPVVEKVARTARNPQVRTAAQECLPFLQQRAEQARIEQTLLRASTSTASPDTLLRPTVATTPTEPQQLLRASYTEDEASSA